jgi:hypothetical protein
VDEAMSHTEKPISRMQGNDDEADSSSSEESCLEIVLPNGKSIDDSWTLGDGPPEIAGTVKIMKTNPLSAGSGSPARILTTNTVDTNKTAYSATIRERDLKSTSINYPDASSSDSDTLNNNKNSRSTTTNQDKKTVPDRWNVDFSSDDDDVDGILNQGPTFTRHSNSSRKNIDKLAAATTENRAKPSCNGTINKNTNAIAATEARRLARLDKEEQKRQEKMAKAAKREEERAEKQRRNKQENESKKRQAEATRQASGKFAHKEIVVLMDPNLHSSEEFALVDALKDDFLVHQAPSALTCNKAIQWVRKDYLLGGAQQALDHLGFNQHDQYEHFDRVIFVLQSDEFIPLLRRAEHDLDKDDDYPALGTWLTALISRWQTVWQTTKHPRIMLLLHRIPEALDRQWVELRKSGQKGGVSPATDAELHDAIQWILIQFQVECVLCNSIENIQTTVHKMTRALCEAPYVAQVSELECIKKIKMHIDPSSDSVTHLERAKDTWLRQLQQVPFISDSIARNVVKHYPTARSLWEAYQQQGGGQGDDFVDGGNAKALLLADILSNNNSRQHKLSKALFRFVTSNDSGEMFF